MTVRIIHTSDTHLRSSPRFELQTPDDLFQAFEEIVYLTKRQSLGGGDAALIHSGDLFDMASPRDYVVERTIDILNELAMEVPNPPKPYFVAGNHDQSDGRTPALDRVIDASPAERLDQNPTILGTNDIAAYGVDYGDLSALVDGDLSFQPPPDDTPVALCLHGTIGRRRLQTHVRRYHETDASAPGIQNAVPFDVTCLLCGHLHKPLWRSETEPSVFYPGAPECVRKNLKGYFPRATCIEVTNYPRWDRYESLVEPVGTHARPWIEFDIEVDDRTAPSDIVNEVFDQWETLVHEKHPDFKETYNLWYNKFSVKEPTVDVALRTSDDSDVPAPIVDGVVDEIEDWGHTHAIRIKYDDSFGDWQTTDSVTAGWTRNEATLSGPE
jgi:DNA repair exonuclease SbcCD nuclease subunit